MTFGALWPFFLLICIPIIVILYMLKQKANDFSFSSLLLWKEAYKNIEATKPWEKLKKNLLMFLQILIILCLIFALTAPYLRSGGTQYQNVILVLDTSASMNTIYKDKETRFEATLDRAKDTIDSLREGASITIVSCNQEAKVEIANTKDKTEAKRKLKELTATDISGDLSKSISLITSMASQWEEYQAVFFTDTDFNMGDLKGSIISMYSEVNNLSVDQVSHGQDDKGMAVLVKLSNQSEADLSTDVNLYGDDALLDIKSISLKAGESQVLYFNELDFSGTILKAEINEADGLMADNIGYDIISNSKENKVLLMTKSNLFIEKAIKTVPGIELYKTNSTDTLDGTEEYNLYIFDNMMPDELPKSGNILYLNPDDNELFKVEGTQKGAMIITEPSQVTQYIEGFSFGVNEIKKIIKPNWADSFLKSGTISTGFYGDYKGRKVGALTFDIHQSDLPLQAEFPVLISNLLNQMLRSGFTSEIKYEAGSKINLNANVNGSNLTVTDAKGNNQVLKPDETIKVYDNTASSGIYGVKQKVEGKTKLEHFIVNFPVDTESSVQAAIEGMKEGTSGTTAAIGGKEIKNILLILALLLLAIEWIVYVKEQ